MSDRKDAMMTREGRALSLVLLMIVQALCALFFLGDVIGDLRNGASLRNLIMSAETLASLALVAGVVMFAIELKSLFTRIDRLDTGLRAARGEMAEVMQRFFDEWSLTPSERDVALLILKGMDNEAISALRGTAVGTVRAQSARVYAKAGVEGRAQLFSVFMEELLAGDLGAPSVPERADKPA